LCKRSRAQGTSSRNYEVYYKIVESLAKKLKKEIFEKEKLTSTKGLKNLSKSKLKEIYGKCKTY